VERPIRYVRRSFTYGRSFAGDGDRNDQAEHWLAAVANVHVHGTTSEVPQLRFERDERALLQPLALRPYQSGVGKTHVAIGLAIAAAQSGRRVNYGTLADLITSLEEAQASGRLQQRFKVLTHPSVLVVDEIGYLPISRTGAMLFFQLMSRRYEHASTVLTSNKSLEEWGEIFGDEVMAAALIDRFLHHCHIVNIRGNSHRVRNHAHLWKQPDAEDAEPARRRRRRSLRAQEVEME
jgi:hypothetical protein